jgi:hypothetical protein
VSARDPAAIRRCHFAVKGRTFWFRMTTAIRVKLMQWRPRRLMVERVRAKRS